MNVCGCCSNAEEVVVEKGKPGGSRSLSEIL